MVERELVVVEAEELQQRDVEIAHVRDALDGGHAEIVRLLLASKADPNQPDFTGRTALTYARQANKASIEQMLRKAGGRE